MKGDRHMVCRTFYHYISGRYGKGPMLRALATGELEYLLTTGGPHAMWESFDESPMRNAVVCAAQGNGLIPECSERFAMRYHVDYLNGKRGERYAQTSGAQARLTRPVFNTTSDSSHCYPSPSVIVVQTHP